MRITLLVKVLPSTLFVALVTALAIAAGPTYNAEASHSESYVFPGAPFSGYYNLGNNAPPSSHHRPWGGHWATDFYHTSGVEGKLWIATNDGTTYAVVAAKGSSCTGNAWAGWAYKFDLRNASGSRGWYLLAHVSDIGMDPFNPYQLYQGQSVTNGATVGWVAFWGSGAGVPAGVPPAQQCYAVNYDSSNHFHVEMGQSIGANHYACYYTYSASQYVWAQDYLGIAGANTSSYPSAC